MSGARRAAAARRAWGAALALAVAWPTRAWADADDDPDKPHFLARRSGVSLFGSVLTGVGLRFNNPYRLATVLGDDAQSVSRTAAYVDAGFGAVFGDPLGLQHGAALRLAFAVEGTKQGVATPSYVVWRRFRDFAAYGRLGLPVVLGPSRTFGVEGAAGGVWFVRGGVGLAGEMVGDVFWGAGTRERGTPAYPILAAQLGVLVAFEVLP